MKNNLFTSLIVLIFCLDLSNCSNAKKDIGIVIGRSSSAKIFLSAKTLQGYLSEISPDNEFNIVEDNKNNSRIQLVVFSNLSEMEKASLFPTFRKCPCQKAPKAIAWPTKQKLAKNWQLAVICGYDERGLLYGVYDALEKLGYQFYLSEDFKPTSTEPLSFDKLKGTNNPIFWRADCL